MCRICVSLVLFFPLPCPIIPLSLSLWFILQLSAKYVLAGQTRSRTIPCVENLAIKCFIYSPREECVADRGEERACVHACIMCVQSGFKQRSCFKLGARLSFVGLQGVEQRGRRDRKSCHQNLSDSASLLINLPSSENSESLCFKNMLGLVLPVEEVHVKGKWTLRSLYNRFFNYESWTQIKISVDSWHKMLHIMHGDRRRKTLTAAPDFICFHAEIPSICDLLRN